jgi:hypothetical protein
MGGGGGDEGAYGQHAMQEEEEMEADGDENVYALWKGVVWVAAWGGWLSEWCGWVGGCHV